MNVYYVYAYLDPRKPEKYKYENYEFDHEPFYIGKGTKSRLLRHLKNERINPIKQNKISKIRSDGLEPIIIKIIDNISNEESLNIEKSLIKIIGRYCKKEGPLTNYSEGGETYLGYKHQEDYINKLKKPVVKYDVLGNKIEEYDSIDDAGKKNNMHPQTVSQICNGGIKIYKNNYIFLYKGVKFEKRFRSKKEYPIIRIDYNFDKKEYKSASEAAKDIGTTVSRVTEVCKGNRFQTSGYLFRYKNHPNQKNFDDNINKNYGKYLNIINSEIKIGNIIYKNMLQAISDGKNVKINNIFNKKISKFNEFKSNKNIL